MTKRLEITSARLVLQALTRDELISIRRGSMENSAGFGEWPSAELVDALPHFINDMMDDPDCIGWSVWVVRDPSSNRIIGDCGFKSRPDENGVVEIAFSIIPSKRGMGYGTEAVETLVRWGFGNGATKMKAEVQKNNEHSMRILKRLQFEQFDEIGKMIYYYLKKDHAPRSGPYPGGRSGISF